MSERQDSRGPTSLDPSEIPLSASTTNHSPRALFVSTGRWIKTSFKRDHRVRRKNRPWECKVSVWLGHISIEEGLLLVAEKGSSLARPMMSQHQLFLTSA